MSGFWLCDICGKRFGKRSVIFEMGAICSCTAQPAAHGKMAIHDGQRPEDVCEHFEKKQDAR